MRSSSYKSISLKLACALCILVSACNNSGTNNGAANTDSTNKMKQAEGTVEQAASETASAVKEAVAKNPDSSFVAEIALSNYEEINMLKAGMDKGTSQALKKDARMMLKDHEGLAAKLSAYAESKNYAIPADDMGNAGKDLNDMAGKTGKDWDKAWANFMFNAHEKAIGAFEGAENKVNDPDLKTIITNTLPTLHQHLDMVKKLLDEMK